MTASIIIEQEPSTITQRIHPHNGYYDGGLLHSQELGARRPPTSSAFPARCSTLAR